MTKPCFENDRIGHRHKVSTIADEKPLFEFEGFVIKEFDGWNMWLENPQGEGTQISKTEFKRILGNIFNQYF